MTFSVQVWRFPQRWLWRAPLLDVVPCSSVETLTSLLTCMVYSSTLLLGTPLPDYTAWYPRRYRSSTILVYSIFFLQAYRLILVERELIKTGFRFIWKRKLKDLHKHICQWSPAWDSRTHLTEYVKLKKNRFLRETWIFRARFWVCRWRPGPKDIQLTGQNHIYNW
jgi:hypothetical protein